MASSKSRPKGNSKTSRPGDVFKNSAAKQVKDRFSQAKTVRPKDRH